MGLPVKVTNVAGKIKLGAIKHAPELLIGAGVVGVVAAAVVACKKTIDAADIIDDFKAQKEDIKCAYQAAEDGMGEEFTMKDYNHEMVVVHGKCAWELFKCYAPAMSIGTASIASILTGARILKKRELAAIATTAALRESFDAYRGRVAAKVGDEVEDRLFRGKDKREVDIIEMDDKGKEKAHKVRYEMPTTGSMYSRIFDASNAQYEKSGMQNFDFIVGRMKYLNYKLIKDGHLFLNDVYKELGFPISVKGQMAGWIYDPADPQNTLLKYVGINDLSFSDQGAVVVDFMSMSDDWKALKNDWERDILIDFANIRDNILEDLPRVDNQIAIV